MVDITDTFQIAVPGDSVLPHSHYQLIKVCKDVTECAGSVASLCYWLSMTTPNVKVKINVHLCQTINEITDRLTGK